MVIAFKPWHLDMIRLTDSVRGVLGKYPSRDIITKLATSGLAFTVIAEEGEEVHIVGVAGAIPLGEKTAEVFVVAAEDRKRYSIAFAKTVRRILDYAHGHFAVIEALGSEGTPDQWFKWLGFQYVGENRWRRT